MNVGSSPIQLPGLPAGTVTTLQNVGSYNIYYGRSPNVNQTSYDGVITPGGSITTGGGEYVVCPGGNGQLDVIQTIDSAGSWATALTKKADLDPVTGQVVASEVPIAPGGAPINSPVFTGHPKGVTEAPLDNSTNLATTAYSDLAVAAEKSRAQTQEALLAPLASPAFTGHPTGVTEAPGTNSARLGTTAYADAAVAAVQAMLKDAATRALSIFDFGCKADCKVLTAGGTVGAGSTAFADTTNTPFAPGDTGKTLILPTGGTGGKGFSTTITYVDSGHVTLAVAAVSAVTNGAYQFGTDDTANLITALNATTNLSLGGAKNMIVSTVPNPNPSLLLANPNQPEYTVFGYGVHIWQAVGTANAGKARPVFDWRVTDGTTVKSGAVWFDIHTHGTGTANYTNSDVTGNFEGAAFYTQQWTDVYVVRCTADGMPGSGMFHRDCRDVWVLESKVTNSTVLAGYNAICFADSTATTSTTSPRDFYSFGNVVRQCVTGGIVMISNGPSGIVVTNGNIEDNDITCTAGNFACIALEVGNPGAIRTVSIQNNIVTQNSTASAARAIWAIDDGASPATDTTKLQGILVNANTVSCAANATAGNGAGAIQVWASNSKITSNTITATGTCGACLMVDRVGSQTDPTIMTSLTISNNDCYVTNAGATNHTVQIGNAIKWSYLGGRIESVSTVTGDGIKVAGGCQFWAIGGNLTIESPANAGIEVISMKDGSIRNVLIHNPNAQNTGGNVGSGIVIQGTAPSGGHNEVNYNTVYDDRGTHQMRYTVLQNGSGTANPTLIGNTLKGALTDITNAIDNWSVVKNNHTDSPSTFPAAASSPAAPASTVNFGTKAYPRMVYFYGGTATAVNHIPNGGSSGQVGNLGNGVVRLDPGDDMNWAYTVAPTLRVVPIQ